MFSILLIIYLLLNGSYVWYARRLSQEQEEFPEVLGRPIGNRLSDRFRRLLIDEEEREIIRSLHLPGRYKAALDRYLNRKVGVVYLIIAIGGLFALLAGRDYVPSAHVPPVIERPSFGSEHQDYALDYVYEGEGRVVEGSLPFEVAPMLPPEEDIKSLLELKYSELPYKMLAEGDSLSSVTKDLNFDPAPFAEPISLNYRSMTPEYITDRGELRLQAMNPNTRYPAVLQATMTMGGLTMDVTYELTIIRQPMSLEEEMALLGERIVVEEDRVILPDALVENQGDVHWATPVSGVESARVFIGALLLALLAFVQVKRSLVTAVDKRQAAILADFPSMVSKLTMLIGAGMTFGRAWAKIVDDYEKGPQQNRPLYEEMQAATMQMMNGVPEKTALENFGRRTGNREAMRLSAVLIQNLKRGSHSLSEALNQLSKEAWEIRITHAKTLGEKASTRLLLPLGISFVAVLMIVLAPAIMNMNI